MFGQWKKFRRETSGIYTVAKFCKGYMFSQEKWAALGIFIDGDGVEALGKFGPRSKWIPLTGTHLVEVGTLDGEIIYRRRIELQDRTALTIGIQLPKYRWSEQQVTVHDLVEN